MDGLQNYLELSADIPGWTRGVEAQALVRFCSAQPDDAVIVEIGAFFGSGSVLLGGACKVKNSGQVHCVDPFDGSGDAVSVRHYEAIIMAYAGKTQRERFDGNIRRAGLSEWVHAHQGTAVEVAEHWNTPVDLLFLDGDQSPDGARLAYEAWSPWLKVGGILALHNSDPRDYEMGHDGHYQLTQTVVVEPHYEILELNGTTTYARKRR